MFDFLCPSCGTQNIDVLCKSSERKVCTCGTLMDRVWLTKPPAAIGDEIDIEIKNGLCNTDGSPRRFTSKAEIARAAKEKGLVNVVEHIGRPGSDKSKHTTRWY